MLIDKKRFSNLEGFTLIELMVVVAIIGIMSMIAIPQYTKYQAKARQTEAKVILSSVYTAEKSFQIENQSYTGCLKSIGVGVDTATRYYTIGYSSVPSHTSCGPLGSGACNAIAWSGNTATSSCAGGDEVPVTANSFASGAATASGDLPVPGNATNITKTVFTIGAAGRVSTDTTASADKWTIDQNRTLTNVTSGL